MIDDIHDGSELSDKSALKNKKKKHERDAELPKVLWQVSFFISIMMLILYLVGIYCTYYNDPKEFDV
jgi:hypothetical protein